MVNEVTDGEKKNVYTLRDEELKWRVEWYVKLDWE